MAGSVPPTVTPVVAGSANIQSLDSDFSAGAAAGNEGLIGYSTESKQLLYSDGIGFKGALSPSVRVDTVTPDPDPTLPEKPLLTDTDSGKVMSNEGAAAQVVYALPDVRAGLRYTFATLDANGIQLLAKAGHRIRNGAASSTLGGTATSTVVGGVLDIIGLNSTEWFAVSSTGTWTLA